MTANHELETLLKILRRQEPTTAIRSLLADVREALASDRATAAILADLTARAVVLGVLSSRSI